ncbi:DUF1684 domain-containing protein [Halanaeroarchaeum sulfurireducens]|uniref:DUF1684 domain-containing protein n=1 Tax=Halanaeroarchaeum sulfurireducens TaxID=1604004 RepID=A0A0F7PEF1_9EURY|nr:DUF1684 domain-containing protein [Halanaeroarchaeum sulfurireducens]AKH97673.1 hypothetical protein HLASF_1186 [Halanaeroarchaeum sulfurireducens]
MPESDFDESAWRERVREYRSEKDAFLATDPDSPIPEDDRDAFDGLPYFSLDTKARVVARLQWVQDPETVELPANRGPGIEYERVGTLGFSYGGDHHVLTAYRAPSADELLVPFRDATSGDETAKTGRYVTMSVDDVETGADVALDFNLAYHPFCVYDDDYVSALPPENNELAVAIRAGERL